MNSVQKTLPLLVATLASLVSTTAAALSLGELVVHSSIGEPLAAEISLIRVPGEDFETSCFRLVSNSGSNDIPWINKAQLRLAGNRLIVTTRAAVNHPAAMLGVQLTCGRQLHRDYPILLQQPQAHPTVPLAPGLPAATKPSTFAPPHPPPRRSVSTRPGEEVPPTASRPPRQSKAPVRRAELSRHDRLILGGEETGFAPLRMSLMIADPPKAEESDRARPPRSQEQRTLAAIDDSIAAQLELNAKIKRLEEYQAMLRAKIAHLDIKPASASGPASPPVAPEPGASPPTQWLQPLAGLIALLMGGTAFVWLRRSRRDATPAAIEAGFRIGAPPSTAQPSRKASREPVAAPAIAQIRPPATPRSTADHPIEWTEPTFTPPNPLPFDETVDEHDSALELAEIMMSFGRTQGAAETLADYIRSNPRQAVKPWLKLLEVYHVAGMQAEFELLTRQLNMTFNVKMVSWDDFLTIRTMPHSIEQLGHISQRLQELWGTQEAQAYIHQILRDNRDGTRQGFPLAVVEEFLLLLAILEEELGPYKPSLELSLAKMESPKADA